MSPAVLQALFTRRSTTPRPAPKPPRPRRSRPTEVPLSVWLTGPLTGCCPHCEPPIDAACAHRLSPTLARRVIDAFSKCGDLVYVPEAGNAACLIAAVTTGRKVLAHAPTRHGADLAYDTLHTQAPQLASLAVLRRGNPGTPPTRPGPDATAQLAIAAPHQPATPGQIAALIRTCARALAPGGTLVITTRQSSGQETAGHLTAHAQAAGLIYLQHIAAVEATATDDRLTPTAPTRHRPGCSCHHPRTSPGRHLLAHHDLLVLTKS
ncbi:hypothetical protein OG455_34715 [Kitasatospora sp. NBC_01287]|uniref:hypothetical protein n=1 Tax=Kitasatospora sp. NBC_01287 TaxID=2903573 RepID=UPI0022520832|nr:hypothetical protein [Kitasatospora sp. NBC_01287]MCX4750603.1 hypothetical protein [Kitasatospora sp. NBC_01287]